MTEQDRSDGLIKTREISEREFVLTVPDEIKVPLPPRKSRRSNKPLEQIWLDSLQRLWPRFCEEAEKRLHYFPEDSILHLSKFTSEGINEEFILSKEQIRKEVLQLKTGRNGQKTAYRFYALGKDAGGQEHDPKLRISRLELFQLFALVNAYGYAINKHRPMQKGGDNDELVSPSDDLQLERLQRSRPERGGSLMSS